MRVEEGRAPPRDVRSHFSGLAEEHWMRNFDEFSLGRLVKTTRLT